MEDLKFGVIGTGRFGKHYLRLLQNVQGVSFVASASRSTGNIEAVLVDPNIDCIVIATPAFTHFEYIKKALEGNKNVLVEKPMVLSVNEAEEVKKLVKASGKIFMVAHQYLYNNHLLYLAKQISLGVLGKLQHITIEHLYPGPIREDVGVFWDAAPHEFAILDLLLGPVSIKTVSGEKKYTSGKLVEDYAEADVGLTNGIKVKLVLSSNAEKKVRQRVFFGNKGRAIFDDSDNNNFLQIFTDNGKSIVPQITSFEPLRNEIEHFIESVHQNQIPRTDIEHGIRVIRNMQMVYQALGSTT